MSDESAELKARLELLEAHTQSFRRLTRQYIRGELAHSTFVMHVGLLYLNYDLQVAGTPDLVGKLYDSCCHCPFCSAVRDMQLNAYLPGADVPVTDLNDGCMAPATHDGSGDCGCPAIAED